MNLAPKVTQTGQLANDFAKIAPFPLQGRQRLAYEKNINMPVDKDSIIE
jgi:hypothetical protein